MNDRKTTDQNPIGRDIDEQVTLQPSLPNAAEDLRPEKLRPEKLRPGESRAGAPQTDDLWVFGYGSLMWRPGFDFEERTLATVRGYRRALCVYSHVHRGTPDKPGLVLGLDRGGACKGVAFRVSAQNAAATLAYLRAREQQNMVYLEISLAATLADGRRVKALCYAVDRRHRQYAGALDLDTLERFVRQGVGGSGPNPDYVRSTLEHMIEIGVADAVLTALVRRLDGNTAHCSGGEGA